MANTLTQIVKTRIKAFSYALAGVYHVIRTQQSAWVHVITAIIVVAAGFLLGLTLGDWVCVVMAIAIVWMAETFNTAVEYLCDVVSPEHSEAVKRAKDIAAGAVLISVVCAIILGMIAFLPHILALI